jgi:hypothetical protein
VAVNPLWWPPSKIAGRYLAPYLAGHVSIGRPEQLEDRRPVIPDDTGEVATEHDDIRRLALTFAEGDADKGDYASALRWLETLEQLDGLLSPPLAKKQAEWRTRAP